MCRAEERDVYKRQNVNPAEVAVEVPRLAVSYVVVQLKRLILGQNSDGVNAGINAVRQGVIDYPVLAPERHGGFGGVFGKHIEPAALSPRKEHGDTLFSSEYHWQSVLSVFIVSEMHRAAFPAHPLTLDI